MAFIKLLTPDEGSCLTVEDVVRKLRDEFRYFHADPEEGGDYVGGTITAVLTFPPDLRGRQEQLDQWTVAQEDSVVVEFGDTPDLFARTCVIPESDLFFGAPEEVNGPA